MSQKKAKLNKSNTKIIGDRKTAGMIIKSKESRKEQ